MAPDRQRRRFFKHLASSASDLIRNLASQAPGQSAAHAPVTSDITGDLTPALLAMEAERLGLDPETDRHMVLESLQAAMGQPERQDLPM